MAPPAAQRPTPYRNFLTPALHRQFVHASVLSLCACYVPAIWMSNSGFIWRFLPLGTLFRAVVLFIVCNAGVLLARLAGQHVGANTATYPFKTFQRALLNPVTYFSIAAYLLSASAFAEVTALSYHSDSYVKLVNPGSHNERAHLNEQGIFFRSLFPILGLVQASYHFYHDIDRVRLPIDKVVVKEMKNIVTILKSKDMMISLAVGAAIKTFVAAVLGAITYFSIYRHLLWDWTLSFLRNFYFFPRNASSRRLLPNGLLSVWGSFLLTAFLLSLVWDFTNLVFSEYMAEQPVKKGQPITTGSKDPNGSLLSGLQAKNELPKTRAFWELVLISNRFDQRRKNLYLELDRAGASTWAQVSKICLQELVAISVRISEFNTSLTPPQPTPLPDVKHAHAPPDKGLKVENIYTPTPSKLISKAKDLAKGRSTDYANPPMLIAEKGLQTLLSDEARAKVNPGAIVEGAGGLFSQILRTPLGYPFRQTFDRHITGIVCGTPYSQTSILVDAIDALTKLAVHSISEDQPGQVQKDIESICRTFAAAIVQVQDFVATTPPHWTDMEFTERKRRPSPEIEALLEALRWGLEEIMRAFGEYFDALNISRSQQKQWTQLLAAPKPAPPVRQIVAEKRAFARPRTPPMQQASR